MAPSSRYQLLVTAGPQGDGAASERFAPGRHSDWHSRLFLLACDGEVVASLRLVLAGSFWPGAQLPSELPGGPFALQPSRRQHTGEFSGPWFHELSQGLYLCAMASAWASAHLPAMPIHAVFAQDNQTLERLYTRSFGLESGAGASVAGSGSRRSCTAGSVVWTLVTDDPLTRDARVRRLLRLPEVAAIHRQLAGIEAHQGPAVANTRRPTPNLGPAAPPSLRWPTRPAPGAAAG